jgi:hypothetical protein
VARRACRRSSCRRSSCRRSSCRRRCVTGGRRPLLLSECSKSSSGIATKWRARSRSSKSTVPRRCSASEFWSTGCSARCGAVAVVALGVRSQYSAVPGRVVGPWSTAFVSTAALEQEGQVAAKFIELEKMLKSDPRLSALHG